ncbi:hypothetical protein [Streptomyces sp. DSM 41634]|uniref:hypothetical protein n=1 Tax=Streptomyces sp. DSM 41634 TaxID=3448656 RepID=UPI002884626E|nr:hypothetical protein [Streptomyces sp. DSM 41633]
MRAQGGRRWFDLTPEGRRALALWEQARRQDTVQYAEKDTAHRPSKSRMQAWVPLAAQADEERCAGTEPAEIPATFARPSLTYADLEGKRLSDFTAPADLADLERLAGPGPVRWLFAPELGDAPRAVNLFCGCGGWCVGLRKILGANVDMLCIDKSADAVATSRAAGCTAVCADITLLDPEHPVFRYTAILIASPPFPVE